MTAAALGAATDPAALVPGDPDSIVTAVAALRSQGDALHRTADALGGVDRLESWAGQAADGFRSAIDAEPARWREAGDSFHRAAAALDHYRAVLVRAQQQAAEALRLWQEGLDATVAGPAGAVSAALPDDRGETLRRAAEDALGRAVAQLRIAGDEAARILAQLRDLAPAVRRWPDEIGAAATAAGDAVVDAAGWVGNAAADAAAWAGRSALDAAGAVGDAVARNPTTALGLGAGIVGAAGIGAAPAGTSAMAIASGSGDTPSHMPWDDPAVRSKIPAEWGEGRPNRSGLGRRWADPVRPDRAGIRIDKGDPAISQPLQQRDHVIVRDNGQVIDRDGRPMREPAKKNPGRSHIPLDEWKRWRTWNHP